MLKIEIDKNTKECLCCGRCHMRKTLALIYNNERLNVGVICTGLWFDINLSGNVYRAIERLEKKISTLSEEEINNIISKIKYTEEGGGAYENNN